jgi:cobalt-zinc-cadmium efflux system outer membrane protein
MKRACFLLLLAACGAPRLSPPDAVFDPAALYPPAPRPDVGALLVQESITLDEFLHAVDRLNPELSRARQEIDAAAAEAFDAGLYPNPSLVASVEDAKAGGSKRVAGLSQEFALTSRFDAARRAREKLRDEKIDEFRLVRRATLMDAKQAFLNLLAARARLDLLAKSRGLAKSVDDLTRVKFESRVAPEISVLKSGVRLAVAEADLRAARRQADVALKSLHVFLGNFDLPTSGFTGALAQEFEPVSIDALRGLILADHPRLEAARRRKEAALLELESARADAWPTVKVEVRGGVDELDEGIVEGALEIALPVFDRGQGRRIAAGLRARQAELAIETARNQLLLELAQAHTNLQAAQERVRTYVEEVLPKAARSVEQAEVGYRAGEFSLLDVLDAQTTFVEAESARLAALEDLNRASTDLERLTGSRLRSLK